MEADVAPQLVHDAGIFAVLEAILIARWRALTNFRGEGEGEVLFFQVQLPDFSLNRLNEIVNPVG